MNRSSSKRTHSQPRADFYPFDEEAHTDHVPKVNDRWLDTGLIGTSTRRILRLNTRPMGFFANPDERVYAEEADSEQTR